MRLGRQDIARRRYLKQQKEEKRKARQISLAYSKLGGGSKKVHKAIFSAKERLIIEEYLKTGKKLRSYRVLKHRIAQYKETIDEDYSLLTKLVEKEASEDSK